MKHIIYRVYLFLCLFGLIGVTCYGKTSYTVQVVASKTPTDIKWFSAKYHIKEKIKEIKEDGWYKYIIGDYKNVREALDYISLNLQSKGLQDPFPRILPDSLKLNTYGNQLLRTTASIAPTGPEKKESLITTSPNIPEKNRIGRATETISSPVENTSSGNLDSSLDRRPQSYEKRGRFEKYNAWRELIGRKNLQKIEFIFIDGAKPYLSASLLPFYIKMVDSAIRFPVILFFLLLIILFFVNAIGIMIILEISNTLKNRIERFNLLYANMYERALTGYIFQEYDIETAVQRVKKIHRIRNRKIFVSVLFNFQKNISGDLDQKILDIFFRLGLHEDAIKKTKSKSFYDKILGLNELTNLYPSGAFSFVEGHINDKNNELRAEAQTSYVRLNHVEPFRFLMSLKKPFTQWTQLTSFYIFRLHKLPAPSFVEYLKSDLYNVRNFSLRMITFFQQKENAEEIIKLLNAERERTRFLAIRAIYELGIQEAKPLLKNIYEKETYKNKLEIVKALKHIGDQEDFGFLENIIREKDVTLKIEACRTMYFMNSLGMENLLRLDQEKELNIESYISHIHDPRN